MNTGNNRTRLTLVILGILAILYIGIQTFIARQYAELSEQTEKRFTAIQTSSIDERKKLEETIALGIENSRKKLFWATFVTNISATIGVLVAFTSIWMGFRQYIQTQEKQQQEQSKARRDRIAMELNTLWQSITSENTTKRAGCAAAMQDLLSPDKAEFHRRVASALALLGRMPPGESVLQVTLRPVIEHAMRHLPTEILSSISWQRLVLLGPDFSGTKLAGIDFRDCDLQEADFSKADLTGARFNAACLNGACFDGAVLTGAELEYADLAGASFKKANLRDANLSNIKLLDADFDRADLRGSESSWSGIDITQAKNWRQSIMVPEVKDHLLTEHGPGPGGLRVLMLMWEMEPIVSGGGWTAAYHFVRNLSRKGADLTVMIPWIDTPVSRSIFGNEIKLIPVGIRAPQKTTGVYGEEISPDAHSQYAPRVSSAYSAYGYGASHSDIVNQFTHKALKWVKHHSLEYDVIHAHDWLTFKAAQAIAAYLEVPWIAHYHSIEAERRKRPARWISRVEADAATQAHALVSPSKVTRRHIISRYRPPSDRIQAVPNCLSEARNAVGRVAPLDPGLVVFVGRRSWQKGPDRFIHIARAIQHLRPQTRFAMYGRDDRDSPFLYGAFLSAYQGSQGTNVKGLIKKTQLEKNPLSLAPMDPEDIENYRKLIRTIRPVRIDGLLIPRPLDALSEKEAEKSITSLLEKGAMLIPYYSSQNGHTHVAIPEDTDDVEESGRTYLLDAPHLDKIAIADKTEHIALKKFIPWQRRYETFRDAAVLVVPSRFEPFGMNVLEAMQAGVAVFAAEQAGVTEVINSIRVFDPTQTITTARQIVEVLRDQDLWHDQVKAQQAEIAGYHSRGYEDRLLDIWQQLAAPEPVT